MDGSYYILTRSALCVKGYMDVSKSKNLKEIFFSYVSR